MRIFGRSFLFSSLLIAFLFSVFIYTLLFHKYLICKEIMPIFLIFRLFFNCLKVYNFSHSSPPKLICYRWSVMAKYIKTNSHSKIKAYITHTDLVHQENNKLKIKTYVKTIHSPLSVPAETPAVVFQDDDTTGPRTYFRGFSLGFNDAAFPSGIYRGTIILTLCAID